MKYITKALPALALILLAGGLIAHQAEARPGHGGHGPHNQDCPCMQSENSTITEEQRQEARKLVEMAQDKIAPLKQALFVKHEELRALQNAATPDVAAVGKKATEITELQQKLSTERTALGKALDTALGLELGTHSFGAKGHGTGHGMGYGRHNGMGCNR